MPPQTMFLTGAPESDSLEWDSAILLKDFITPIARFSGLPHSVSDAIRLPSSPVEYASWRLLDLDRQCLSTGHSQIYAWTGEYQGNADFFTTSGLSFTSSNSDVYTIQLLDRQGSESESINEVLSQFYQHSINVHANTESFQSPVPQLEQASSRSDLGTETSFGSNETFSGSKTECISSSPTQKMQLTRPPISNEGHVLNLKDIPNAKFLDSIQPQTMAVNLIVGIISVAPLRVIKTRYGTEVEILELLVGDETKSGFGVNFWLPLRSENKSERNVDDIRNILTTLRSQDIVLLRNVAISSFQGRVYGQSFRKGMTKVHLLYRNRVNKADIGGYYKIGDFDTGQEVHPQLLKTMHVKDWVLRFVAPGNSHKTGENEAKIVTESLPPDTQ